MKYESYMALAEKGKAYPEIAVNQQLFVKQLIALRPIDPVGYTALSFAVGAPELAALIRPRQGQPLNDDEQESNQQNAQQLCARLQSRGLKPFQAFWAVSCWFNALAWPFVLRTDAYREEVENIPIPQREALAMQGDGYCAASLAALYESSGDVQSAAQWRKAAYDAGNLETMRWMEKTAVKSGMSALDRLSFIQRHALLGDPEGLAAYALTLMDIDLQSNAEKAFQLAMQSAAQNSPAGHFAMYRLLLETGDDPSAAENASAHLETAARGGYPDAYVSRALRHRAAGRFSEAYRDLQSAMQDTPLYAASDEAAVLLERLRAEDAAYASKAIVPETYVSQAPEALESVKQPDPPLPIEEEPEEELVESALVEPEPVEAPSEEPQQTSSLLFYCIGGVWNQVAEEMLRQTGADAPPQMLVDTFLTCLCGSLVMCDPAQQSFVYQGLIAEFCSLMPSFAQLGYQENYLHERFVPIAQAMGQCRSRLRMTYEQNGGVEDGSWNQKAMMEADVILEVLGRIVQPDEIANDHLRTAVEHMFSELNTGNSAN